MEFKDDICGEQIVMMILMLTLTTNLNVNRTHRVYYKPFIMLSYKTSINHVEILSNYILAKFFGNVINLFFRE